MSIEATMSEMGHSQPGRASSMLSHVRYAPKATDNRFRPTCRDGPSAEMMHRNKVGAVSKLVVRRAAHRATPSPPSDRACRSLR